MERCSGFAEATFFFFYKNILRFVVVFDFDVYNTYENDKRGFS